MSRLNSFIRRLSAQRDCLGYAATLISNIAGPVLELGLGNGRTYDHVRSLLPERDIFVFDRQIAAHPDCIPDDAHMILGDFSDTIPRAMERIGIPAALAHVDCGSGDAASTKAVATTLEKLLPALMTSGGIIVSDQPVKPSGWQPLSLPDGVPKDRYFIVQSVDC
jgi:hypothetical protein